MADMNGRIIMVTGATDGIGKITALELARMGATVVVVGRSSEKGANVVSEIRSATNNPNVEFMKADLSLMLEVRRLADTFKAKYDRLHVLVNNAGAVFQKRQETSEGNEMTFALNHLNYFLLTNLLLDTIKASGTPERKARIVNVSSDAHRFNRPINFDDLQNKQRYSSFGVYGQSKLMNILFTFELARRLNAENANVTANVLHPGLVATRFNRNNGPLMNFFMNFTRVVSVTPEKGAETTIYLASSPAVEDISGAYFSDKKVVTPSAAARDEQTRLRLWQASEAITGIQSAANA
ncbi:MAG: SDR family oxidoreductase [bacterium]|nr:SDR family oxidoreductase [bacterium]